MLVHGPTKRLILNVKDIARLTTVIPSAKVFQYKGRDLVTIPHRIDETTVLRNMGIAAPSPIKYHYTWSGQFAPFFAQRETADFLTLHPKAFVLNDMGCVDAATEYLSPTGWVRMDQYAGGYVAQYHPETGDVEFVPPTRYVKLPCHDMLRLKTKYGVDQLLSPEHRVLLHARGNSEKRETLAAVELQRRHDAWMRHEKSTRRRDEIAWTQAAVPAVFNAPAREGIALCDDDIRLMVAVIADGHFPNNSRTCIVRLLKERKKVRLRALLDRAGATYREVQCKPDGFSRFSFYAPIRTKVFDADWWSATRHQLEVITSEVMHWDGSVSTLKPGGRFTSSVGASADFVQYAYAATGRTARITSNERRGSCEYTVHVRDNGKPLQLTSVSSSGEHRSVIALESSPDGFKYCFMVPSTYLIFRRNGCIFASGNTGKTMSALWAYDYLRSQGRVRKMLVVSPLSTLERTWADEVFRHFPHLNTSVLYGTKERRLKMLGIDADIYLINHDGLDVIKQALMARDDIDVVVVDEIATFRNASTRRWKALRSVIGARPYVWGLTGTPTPNSPTDAWAQCRLICPERVPTYMGKFRDSVMMQLGQFKWVPRNGATDIVADAMQPAVRFTRDQCLDLPPVIYQPRHAELTAEQKAAYKSMVNKLHMEYEAGQVIASNEAIKMSKLVQIACGVVYGVNGEEVLLPCASRVDAVKEIIEQANTKTIVFVPYKAVLAHVAMELRKEFGDDQVVVISGDVGKTARDQVIGAFQSDRPGTPRILVAQPAAMSHGLTLTAASTIVWYAPVTSHETYQQANARITRPGQKHTQFVVTIGGTEVERRIYARLAGKEKMQGLLLSALQT